MKCLFFSALILFNLNNAKAQGTRSLGLTLKSGVGELKRISDNEDFIRPNTITTSPAFAWGIAVDVDKQWSPFLSGQSQIGYQNIRSNEIETYAVTNVESGEMTIYKSETLRNANFLSLATIFNVHPNPKMFVGMGISINFLLTNSYLTKGYTNDIPAYIIGGGNDLLKLDLGLNPQMGFQVAENLKVYCMAQFGLMNVRDPERKDNYSRELGLDSGNEIILKSRLYSIGLKYTLFKDNV